MTATQIQEQIAILRVEQQANADDALFHDRPKEKRKQAKMRFYHTAGKIAALKEVLSSL